MKNWGARMLYLIIGRIDPRKTMEARRLASEGKFDPPANVRFLIEYEEPDGSYFELVEADGPDAVRTYMDKSRHLFNSFEYYETAALGRFEEAEGGTPCYALYYQPSKGAVNPGFANGREGGEIHHEVRDARVVLHVRYQEDRGLMVVQATRFESLFRFAAGMLSSLTELTCCAGDAGDGALGSYNFLSSSNALTLSPRPWQFCVNFMLNFSASPAGKMLCKAKNYYADTTG